MTCRISQGFLLIRCSRSFCAEWNLWMLFLGKFYWKFHKMSLPSCAHQTCLVGRTLSGSRSGSGCSWTWNVPSAGRSVAIKLPLFWSSELEARKAGRNHTESDDRDRSNHSLYLWPVGPGRDRRETKIAPHQTFVLNLSLHLRQLFGFPQEW